MNDDTSIPLYAPYDYSTPYVGLFTRTLRPRRETTMDFCRIDDMPDQDTVLETEYEKSQVPDGDEIRDMQRQQEVDDLARERRIAELNESLEEIAQVSNPSQGFLTKRQAD